MAAKAVRLATYNVALNRPKPGQLAAELARTPDAQIEAVLHVICALDADILVLNEVDYDPEQLACSRLQTRLRQAGCDYPYAFSAPVNTGVLSGRDLINPGGPGNTPFGFGAFPGQYGMLVLSRLLIDVRQARTFQHFLWRDLPGARFPQWPDGKAFYNDDDLAVLRLSSKSHWDLPIDCGHRELRLLVSHPTPPAFDGPEGRNRWHNNAEIDFWVQYLSNQWSVTDDQGRTQAFTGDAFVLAGDLNAEPQRGDSLTAINQLLDHPTLQDPRPTSPGALQHWQGRSEHEANTAVWGLRADYLLPSKKLPLENSQVIWPLKSDPLARSLIQASDHRPVVLDIL